MASEALEQQTLFIDIIKKWFARCLSVNFSKYFNDEKIQKWRHWFEINVGTENVVCSTSEQNSERGLHLLSLLSSKTTRRQDTTWLCNCWLALKENVFT